MTGAGVNSQDLRVTARVGSDARPQRGTAQMNHYYVVRRPRVNATMHMHKSSLI